MGRLRLHAALALLVCALAACSRLSASGDGGAAFVPPGDAESADPPPTLPTLLSAAAGPGLARLAWFPAAEEAPGLNLALFSASDAAALDAAVAGGVPQAGPLAGSALVLGGLVDGAQISYALAARPAGGSQWTLCGARLAVRPGPVIYVRDGADPAIADGLTPATAFPDPASGVISAFLAGGGNVWFSGGDYGAQSLGLFGGVHLYGGFDASFAPELRSSEQNPTTFRGLAGAPILATLSGGGTAIADGLRLEGDGLAQLGVDAEDQALELRDVSVRACQDRGIRLRNTQAAATLGVRLAAVSSSSNGADGLSVAGAFQLALDACSFEANVQEGIDCNDLVAPDGGQALLALRDVLLAANGTDGLDATLAAPAGGGSGGTFGLRLDGCRAERNAGEGLFVDIDYELQPGWDLSLEIRGSRARANGQNGIHLDLDDECDVLIERCVLSANRADGLHVSSEDAGGFVLLATSVLAGNHGAGARAIDGLMTLCASQCIFSGNTQGGLLSALVDARAAGSIAWLQGSSWASSSAGVDVPSTAPSPFERAPWGWLQAVGLSGSGIEFSGDAVPFPGAGAELDDDGAPRLVTAVGADLAVDPQPDSLNAPATLALFADASSVEEDWQLAPGSAAQGAGLFPTGAAPTDAGPYGVPGSDPLGSGAELPADSFRAARLAPAPTQTLPPAADLEVSFLGGELDPASVSSASVRAVLDGGTTIALLSVLQLDGTLRVTPASGSWGTQPFALELAGLTSLQGIPLAAPLALALHP